jgi:tRNA pseudouridine55 synthase
VRQLVTALGDAYCEELERTAIGEFQLEDAESFVPLATALNFLPGMELGKEAAASASNGVAVPGPALGDAVRLTHSGRLIGIAKPDGDVLKPFVVFPSA